MAKMKSFPKLSIGGIKIKIILIKIDQIYLGVKYSYLSIIKYS